MPVYVRTVVNILDKKEADGAFNDEEYQRANKDMATTHHTG